MPPDLKTGMSHCVDSNKLRTGLVYSREIISYILTTKRLKFQRTVVVSKEVV